MSVHIYSCNFFTIDIQNEWLMMATINVSLSKRHRRIGESSGSYYYLASILEQQVERFIGLVYPL